MNKEFQELKRKYLQSDGEEKRILLSQMRDNLKKRNENNALYTNIYTHQGETVNIETSDEQKLFEIDGDMVVMGK